KAAENEWTPVFSDTDNTSTLTIAVPKVENEYSLSKDQTITLKVPYQLLENDVQPNDAKFTILAQPKVLISGTATPSISQTDFANGEKTIILTLVNASWATDIAASTEKREKLLEAFNWDEMGITAEIKARADVKRSKDNIVVIKLPAIAKKISKKEIQFDAKKAFKNVSANSG